MTSSAGYLNRVSAVAGGTRLTLKDFGRGVLSDAEAVPRGWPR